MSCQHHFSHPGNYNIHRNNDSKNNDNQAGYPVLNAGPGAKWIKHLTRDRLDRFTGGLYSDSNLTSILFTHKLDNDAHVKLQVWSAPGLTKPSFEEAMKQTFKPAKKGDSFGPSWTNHWWKVSLKIPTYWEQYERVQFEFDPGCEAMVFTTDGTPLQGITGGFGGDRRVEYIIPRESVLKGSIDLVLESTCNGMFGVPWNGDTIAPPDMNRFFRLASADLVVPNMPAWHLLWDFTTLKELASTLPGNTPLQNQAITVANEIMNVFEHGTAADVEKARKLAEQVFGEGWQAKGDGVYKEGTGEKRIWGIGHCHIDTAWLWPYHVTQQKVARSWSTQVDLMNRYPEHRFTCSSAQQYKWLEQLYPKLFKQVAEKIVEGKFHPVGGSWVENDANMPSGEALVRQLLYGQRYFQSRFGVRCQVGWLPDSFGLTGALPQILRGAGMKWFFTQKLSWNNINNFPHSTFNWVGIDGTQVLCHMTPVDTYTAQATVGDVNKGLTNHKNLESSSESLLVFGNGDGGGGPLPKMLENLRRIRAVTNTHRELPPVSMGHSVDEFFDELTQSSGGGSKLPNWHGELYLEFHRGTYTSHGSIKKGNRHSEILLRDVENICTYASLYVPSKKYAYPKATIDDCWEKLLLNQFHDVLPGSAIGMVYDDAEKLYAEITKDGHKMLDDALNVLFPDSVSLDQLSSKQGFALGKLIAYNTTPFSRRKIIEVPMTGAVVSNSNLKSMVAQVSGNGRSGYVIMDCADASSSGSRIGSPRAFDDTEFPPAFALTNGKDHFVLKNGIVQLTITQGRITSLLDSRIGRELIAPGKTGGLMAFEDKPLYWPAWDVEVYHLETAKELSFDEVTVVAQGPLRASVQAKLKYGKSTIVVTISLDAVPATTKADSCSMFTFDAEVDWRQRNEFLKFSLPLDLHSDNATYETPFGWVQRSTHKNTSWDQAKFEVCGHKYADFSEYGYGVAILSESKYGFSCRGNVLSISLLRSATAPDAEQDQGHHRFSWAILPHQGSFLESDVPQAAYLFNSPLYVRCTPNDSEPALVSPPLRIGGAPNIILETIKRGEDDDFASDEGKTVILRLYEAFGGHGRAGLLLSPALDVEKAFETNLLEDHEKELNIQSTADQGSNAMTIPLSFRGFEVKTVKLILGKGKTLPAGQDPTKRESWVTV